MSLIKKIFIPVVFAAFAFVLLSPYLNGHWQLADDAYYNVLPNYIFQSRIMSLGSWPHYNLNVGLGQPTDVSFGSGPYYPPQILWGLSVGWTQISYLWYLFIHLVAGGLIAFWAGRKFDLSEAASTFGALAYVGSGFCIGMFSNFCILFPVLLWPWLIGSLKAMQDEKQVSFRVLLSLALSLVFIETIAYPLVKMILYPSTILAYWLLARKAGTIFRGPKWAPLFLAGGAAILITAPEWVGAFRMLKHTDRMAGGGIYEHSLFHNVSNFFQFATMFLPGQFLQRDKYQIGIMHLERSWWIGTLTLVFLMAGFFRGLIPLKKYFPVVLIAFVAFFFSLGGHSFLRETSSILVPILGGLRHSHMARICVMLLMCFFAAKALSELEKERAQRTKQKNLSGGRWVLGGWLLFLGLATAFGVSESGREIVPATLYTDSSSGWKAELVHHLFYLVLALTVYFKWGRFFKPRSWVWGLVAIQFLVLADVGYGYRRLIAWQGGNPLKPAEQNFKPASPQPNERSIARPFTGTDWYNWEGNRKVLHAYLPPALQEFNQAISDPKISPLLGSLVSCYEDREVPCKAAQFTIDSYFGNSVKISGSTGSVPARIVVHDLYSGDWRATLNGADVEVYRAFNYFKAVDVPANLSSWKLEFQYRHPYFPLLWYVSAFGLGLLLLSPRILRIRLR